MSRRVMMRGVAVMMVMRMRARDPEGTAERLEGTNTTHV